MGDLHPAPKGYPIKVVRDRTDLIINSTGEPGDLFYAPLPAAEVLPWLKRKLIEEVGEYVLDGGLDELADVLAVVAGLAAQHGLTFARLRELADEDERGGFFDGQMMYGYHSEFDGRAAS